MRIAHVSDIHFGRIAHPGIVEDLVKDINNAGVDLVAISGDLTQRALHGQFQQCQQMLGKFLSPLMVVPGNHDVFSWLRPIARVKRPLSRYKKYFGNELTSSFEKNGVAVLGVNSAHGKTIKGGRITPEVSQEIVSFFDTKSDRFKILVLHHHLKALPALKPHDTVQDAERHFNLIVRSGVNLVLCGHMHISHVESLDREVGYPCVIASAGTATSDRGRRSNRKKNYYNLIDISSNNFVIQEKGYSTKDRVFNTEKTNTFERT